VSVDGVASYARHRGVGHPPNALLVEAISALDRRGERALDVGAGTLTSSKHLLGLGYRVTAVDPDPYTADLASGLADSRLDMRQVRVQDVPIESGAFDVVVALHVLHLLSDTDLEPVVHRLIDGLAPGGVLCATFLGPRDSWARTRWRATATSRERVAELTSDLDVVRLDELCYPGRNVLGEPKYWHVLRCVARRTPAG
jgi:SAM-dependent methyltransferase